MTPQELITACRRQYNSVGDSFFSDSELLDIIYDAETRLSEEAITIENSYTTSTVVNQQDYAYPTNAISIMRISYNGAKLQKITMQEDDELTIYNSATTVSGTPRYYFIWSNQIYLRPIPSAIGTLKIFTYNKPALATLITTFDTPSEYHTRLIDYVLSRMALKDENFNASDRYSSRWDRNILDIKRLQMKRKRSDEFGHVNVTERMTPEILRRI